MSLSDEGRSVSSTGSCDIPVLPHWGDRKVGQPPGRREPEHPEHLARGSRGTPRAGGLGCHPGDRAESTLVHCFSCRSQRRECGHKPGICSLGPGEAAPKAGDGPLGLTAGTWEQELAQRRGPSASRLHRLSQPPAAPLLREGRDCDPWSDLWATMWTQPVLDFRKETWTGLYIARQPSRPTGADSSAQNQDRSTWLKQSPSLCVGSVVCHQTKLPGACSLHTVNSHCR